MRATAFWLSAVALFAVVYVGFSAFGSAIDPCLEFRGYPHELRGWHGDVKCYGGQVVDYR